MKIHKVILLFLFKAFKRADACTLNITFTNNTLSIASQVSVCIQDVLGIDCSHNIEKNINIKNNIKTLRSIGEGGSRRQDEKQTPREEGKHTIIALPLNGIFDKHVVMSCCNLICFYRSSVESWTILYLSHYYYSNITEV